MIKKTFIAALIFFALHALFIRVFPTGNSQNQWQDNIVKAQHYIYCKDTIQSVIIGTSMSNRLIIDSLPGFYNFSLQGQSIYDCFYVLSKKEELPKKIFIEMNIVIEKENEKFLSSLYSPVLYGVRKIFPSLRDEYQPVGQFSKIFIDLLNKINPNSTLLQRTDIKSNIFNEILVRKIKEYSKIPDKNVLADRFSKIKEYVNLFEKRGTQVIFFEMPMNEKICNLPKAKIIREYYYKTFPIERYNYIPIPAYNNYITRDGEHLGPEEALRYTLYFKSQLKNFN